MSKIKPSVLTSRMYGIGHIQQDTNKLGYYTELLNRISNVEVSISWVENLLVPHGKADFMEWRSRIELVHEWIGLAKADAVQNKDLALMMELSDLAMDLYSSLTKVGYDNGIQIHS